MNDLNSVFVVGRVQSIKLKEPVEIVILNNHYSFNEETKEYEEVALDVKIFIHGKVPQKKAKDVKKGMRIGVNGRLCKEGVVCYSFQNLERDPPGKSDK